MPGRQQNGKSSGRGFIERSVLALTLVLGLAACGTNGRSSKGTEPEIKKKEKITVVTYVALGDSTGVGVGARQGGYVSRLFNRISRERPSSTLTNLCVSGATSDDIVREQLKPGIAARPNLVTIGIGINDLARGVTEDSYARNLEEIITRLKSETNSSIVITNLPDISLAPVVPAQFRDQLRSRIVAFNQKINEAVERHGLLLVDVYSSTREMIPTHPEFFSVDKFHPSDVGYEFWAKLMWPTVQKAIEK